MWKGNKIYRRGIMLKARGDSLEARQSEANTEMSREIFERKGGFPENSDIGEMGKKYNRKAR